ncbi:SpaA isopeptide-forming pilin-related protein [Paenibacillus borealis]|uniref:SpaA isopeptide-forming pilin-related protein n=1 Tax=Paenibacillus borealis TaxID=160799 RepID=UPI001C54E4F0|nr:SpaA isopeptide-forming pilin-related protein [Paenibacillus borealis]
MKTVTLSVYENGTQVTDNVYKLDSTVKLNLTYELPDAKYDKGATYTYTLPSQLKINQTYSGTLVNSEFADGIGTYTVGADNKVVFVFNENIEGLLDIKGTFWVESTLSSTTVTGSTTQVLYFPIAGNANNSITLQVQPSNGKAITKTGTPMPQKYNASSIDWTVDVNTLLNKLDNAVITDPMQTGLELDPASIAVYALTVDVKGNLTLGGQVSPALYDTTASDLTKLDLKFKNSINEAYRVKFTTKNISTGEQTKFNNTATLTANGSPESASAEVNINLGKTLEKFTSGYNSSDETITWEIRFNYNEKPITSNNAVLTDYFNITQDYVAGSMIIYKVKLDQNGSGTDDGTLIADTDYTLTQLPDVSGTAGFKLQFNHDIQSAYRIVYKTKVAERVYTGESIVNKATYNGQTVQASTSTTQRILNKQAVNNGTDVDYLNKTVKWTIKVNEDSRTMTNLVLTDKFTNAGLQLIGKPAISPALVEGTDYEITNLGSGEFKVNEGFVIKFLKPITKAYTITYSTKFDYYSLITASKYFINTASILWDEKTSSSAQTSSSTFTPDAKVIKNGFKTGKYDIASKKITWTVGANYNKRVLAAGAELVDTLPAGQQVVAGTVIVNKLNYGADGAHYSVNPPLVEGTDYTVTVTDKLLKVKFKDSVDYAFYVVFKTEFIDGDINLSSVTNNAILNNSEDKPVSEVLSGSASVTNGGQYVTKTGSRDSSDQTIINWTVTINANQSNVSNVQIVDTPSSNQVLLPESFQLVETTVNPANGTVNVTANKLERDKDYTLDFITDSTGKDTFKLAFTDTIDKPYILTYKSVITAVGTVPITNAVSFSGVGSQLVSKPFSFTQSFTIVDTGGTGSGVKGSLKVLKTNADQTKNLQGAEFSLGRIVGTELKDTVKATSDSAGNLEFTNLRAGKYVLKETKAPTGYALDTTARTVTINSSTPVLLTVTNDFNGSLKLTKVAQDDSSRKLAGAEFELYDATNTLVGTGTADANGVVLFTKLMGGSYTYKETKAPAGYKLNGNSVSVTIDPAQQKAVTVTNEALQGSLKLIKVDKDDAAKKLAGAKFELYNSSNTLVATSTTNASGEIVFSNLKFGTYSYQETAAPAGYELDSTKQTITIDSDVQKVLEPIKNTATLGSLKLVKVDAADSTKKLAGAKFELYNSSNAMVAAATTNASGEIIFDNLKVGAYTLEETKAPAGYDLDSTVRNITISSKVQQVLAPITNKETLGSLKLVKVDAADGTKKLAGAKFELYDSSDAVVAAATTNANGEIVFNNLKLGDYTLKETEAPTGYELDGTVRNIKIDSMVQQVLQSIPNKATTGSLKLIKVDAADGTKKLAGAKFELYNSSNTVVAAGTTNANGEIVFDDLKLGTYTLEEVKAPAGYDLDGAVRNITINSKVQQVLDPIKNKETLGSLKLVKVDYNNANKKLAGAEFKLYNSGNVLAATGVTDTNGEIVFDDLKLGDYTLEETKAPTGYDLDGAVRNVKIISDIQKVLNPIPNKETIGSIKFVKVDATDGTKKLEGAVFKLTNSSKVVVGTKTTNANGEIVFDNLKVGVYTLEETAAPAGYDLDGTPQNITINSNVQKVLDPIKNQETLGSLKLVKVDAADTAKKLAGAEFKLTNSSSGAIVTGTTNVNGELVFNDLKLGKYTLEETKAPAGYDLDESVRNITISEKAQQVLAPIKNVETLGSLKLVKVDAADTTKKLAGAEFKLTNSSNVEITKTTNASGEIVFDDLKLGSYTLEETKAPAGYELDSTPKDVTITVKAQQVLPLIKNVETLGSLKLVKVDAADATKKLKGAEFKLTNSSTNVVVTKTTNVNGEIVFEDLKLGTYTLEETKAPTGYDLDSTERTITINSKAQQILAPITNKETLGSIKLVKIAEGNAARKLAGAEFKLYDSSKNVVATAITNVNGEIEFKDLKLGVYTLQETVAPTGYYLDSTERSITIDSGVQKVLEPITNKDIPAPTGAPGTNPVVTPTPTPVSTVTPGVTSTPGPSATGVPGVTFTPGPTPIATLSPTTPAVSSAPTPQATSATTVEDIPIDGEIPLGGIPSISVEPSHGTVVVTPDGKWTYTPDPGYTGKDKFTITVTDEDGNDQDIIIEVGVDEVPTGTVTDTNSDDDGLPGDLPKTGEESPLPLYLMGGGLVVLGILLARRFKGGKKPE